MKRPDGWHSSAVNKDTIWKDVSGVMVTDNAVRMQKITVRISSDKTGATMSVSDDRTTQYTIPLEQIADGILEALMVERNG